MRVFATGKWHRAKPGEPVIEHGGSVDHDSITARGKVVQRLRTRGHEDG